MTPTTQPAEHTKLLPCPFCGSGRAVVNLYNRPCVVCHECLAAGPPAARLLPGCGNRAEAATQARELWNRRAGIPAPNAIEQARELIARLVKWDKDFPKGRIYPIGPHDGEKQLDAIVADAALILSNLTPATDKQG